MGSLPGGRALQGGGEDRLAGRVFQWLKKLGGLTEMARRNEGKARLLYNVLGARSCFRNAEVRWGRAGWWDSAEGAMYRDVIAMKRLVSALFRVSAGGLHDALWGA